MEIEKIADIPISGGTGVTCKKGGGYMPSQVTKFRIPKKIVDILKIPRHDKDGMPIRIPLFISPSLSKAAETGEFYLVFKFNINELDIEERMENAPKEEETKVTSGDFDISNIINEREEM